MFSLLIMSVGGDRYLPAGCTKTRKTLRPGGTCHVQRPPSLINSENPGDSHIELEYTVVGRLSVTTKSRIARPPCLEFM